MLSLGLRSDYAALIEKRDLAALSYTKQGRQDADLLLKEKPDAYDAYIALGVENYLTGIKPAPVRWILQMGGMNTDKALGIAELQKTADHGVLLAPFAKLLSCRRRISRERHRQRAASCSAGWQQPIPQIRSTRKSFTAATRATAESAVASNVPSRSVYYEVAS